MKRTQPFGIKQYTEALVVFFIFMVASIGIFFLAVQGSVEKNAVKTMQDNIQRQGFHFQSIIDIQYEYLEAAAEHAAQQEELFCDHNMELIKELRNNTHLERTLIVDPEGYGFYDNDEEGSVAQRKYFQKTISGERSLSTPLVSSVDDEIRLVLSVPIYQDGQVIGMLGGSFNLDELHSILFEDIYDGESSVLILASDGTVIYSDECEAYQNLGRVGNFFEYDELASEEKKELVEEIRSYFQERKGGFAKVKLEGIGSYFTYEPMEMNDWMICCVVPEKKAQESYAFIQQYEIVLSGMLAIAVLLMILLIWRMNAKEKKELLVLAQKDMLTSLLNKKRTEEVVNEWLQEAPGESIQAFIMLDLDEFKMINDVYGHPVGDETLQEFGKILRAEFRDSDILGRVGGDEFVILMKNVKDVETVTVRIMEMKRRLEKVVIPDADTLRLSCSVGIALSPEAGRSYQELYQHADEALYATKKKGKNGYSVYGREEN